MGGIGYDMGEVGAKLSVGHRVGLGVQVPTVPTVVSIALECGGGVCCKKDSVDRGSSALLESGVQF